VNFPSFGDADSYMAAGRACAAALAGDGGRVFDACYHPLRPRPIVVLMAVPHLVTSDPVDASYVLLLGNLLFAAGAVAALFSILVRDSGLLAGRPWREQFLMGAAVLTLLPNVVSLVPVALGDLPALLAFLMAVRAGAAIVASAEPSPARRYAVCGVWVAAAVLVKQTYLLHGAVFAALLLLLDPHPRHDRDRVARGLFFLAGLSPVLLQFADVYLHSGHFWLFDPAAMRVFSYPSRGQAIEAMFFTAPQQGAYTVKPATPLAFPSLVAMRLFRGIFGFEWAVYHGRAFREEWWPVPAWQLAAAWTLALLYFGFVATVLRRAGPSLRLFNAAAAAVALCTALIGHTELRYYALPRTALWLTAACAAACVAARSRGADTGPEAT